MNLNPNHNHISVPKPNPQLRAYILLRPNPSLLHSQKYFIEERQMTLPEDALEIAVGLSTSYPSKHLDMIIYLRKMGLSWGQQTTTVRPFAPSLESSPH